MKLKPILFIVAIFCVIVIGIYKLDAYQNQNPNLYARTGECSSIRQYWRLEKKNVKPLDYEKIEKIKSARGQVRAVVTEISSWGCMAFGHYFNISYDTTHMGVKLSPLLKSKYPETITIILQHEYRDLQSTKDGISVTVYFDAKPDTIFIPYDAITYFGDPSRSFVVDFKSSE